MPKNPPEGMPRITPHLYYRDVRAAMDWLVVTFGFRLRLSLPNPDGSIQHAELEYGSGVVMLGPANLDQGTNSARALGGVSQSLYVYVDDIRSHLAQAKLAGATVTSEIAEMFWGDNVYTALDLEGQHWTFAEHMRNVSHEGPPR